MIWPMLSRRCTRESCRPAVTICFGGTRPSRSSDVKTGLDSEIDAISAVPDFSAPTESAFPWTRAYQRDEWLDQLVTRSDHTALEPAVRDRLFEAIGRRPSTITAVRSS